MLKKYRLPIILFYVLAVGALVAAYFVDLQLDIRLNDPHNAFAMWMRSTGEIPARLVPIAAGVVILRANTKRWQKGCGLALLFGGSLYMGIKLAELFFTEEHNRFFGVLWGLGYGVAFLFFSRFVDIPKKYKKALTAMAVIGVAVFAVSTLLVEGIKNLWGRVRYRDLLAAGSTDAFTDFLTVNGVNGNRSFPSGHTQGASMIYLAMFLPYLNKKFANYRVVCWAVPMLYTSAVAYTRLVMGAHYLSDVAVGGAVGFTCVLIGLAVFERLDAKKHWIPYS